MEPIPDIDSVDLRTELAEEFRRSGFTPPMSSFLAEKIVKHGLLPDAEKHPGVARGVLDAIASQSADVYLRWVDDPDVAWLRLLDLVYGTWGISIREPWTVDDDAFVRFLNDVATDKHLGDFGPALRTVGVDGKGVCNFKFVHLLRENGCFKPDAVLDASGLRSSKEEQLTYGGLDGRPGDLDYDFRRLGYWLYNDTDVGLEWFFRALRAEPDATVASLVGGFERAVRDWFKFEELDARDETGEYEAAADYWGHLDGPAWRELATRLVPIVDELERRAERFPDDVDLNGAWLYYSGRVYQHMQDQLSDERRRKLTRAARERLGWMRPSLGSADRPAARAAFEAQYHMLGAASVVLMLFDSVWASIKPLLLALRQLPEPAVSPDLRYWPEVRNDPFPPPDPWWRLPQWVATRLHHGLRREQAADPKLVGVRTEFGRFLLERLRTRKDTKPPKGRSARNEDMVDPDPAWRLGYVRSLRALHINPEGKGHRTVNWSRQFDPDGRVREEAASAYKELRHGPSVPQKMSPRRPVFAAFLWLRRAHLEALGCEVDEAGAKRTFRKEVRRTEDKQDDVAS